MASSFLDVCRFNPTLGGTTNWTYSSAALGYQSPAAAGAVNGAVYSYRAESADLTQWEVGIGVYTTGTGVLTRASVLFNSLGTTAKINFTTVPQVGIVALAEDLVSLPQIIGRNYFDGWNRADITGTTGLTVSAANILAGLIVRSGTLAGAVNDTTDTAANIVAAGPGANSNVTSSFERSYGNLTGGGFTVTLVGGTGVSVSGLGLGGAVASGVLAKFRYIISNSTPGSEAITVYRVG